MATRDTALYAAILNKLKTKTLVKLWGCYDISDKTHKQTPSQMLTYLWKWFVLKCFDNRRGLNIN